MLCTVFITLLFRIIKLARKAWLVRFIILHNSYVKLNRTRALSINTPYA